jgi:organic hydroperoxide reductase OsmC/OhrA
MTEIASQFTISIDQTEGYEFLVKFDKDSFAALVMDEPPPLGADKGPNAARVLAAAIGNCLSASFLFCARKAHIPLGPIHTEVKVQIVRTTNRRLRVGKVEVLIDPHLQEAEREKARRCVELFEDFCVVSQSVRQGIDIAVFVKGLS